MKNVEEKGGLPMGDYEALTNDYLNYRNVFTDEVKARVFQTADQVAAVISECISDVQPGLRYLTSDSAKEFAHLKTGLDPSGVELQKTIRDKILNK